MKRLLERRAEDKTPWRQVPKFDMLERTRLWSQRRTIAVALAALLLGGGYLLGNLYWEGLAVARDLEGARVQIRSVQRDLTSRSSQVKQLQAELQQLRERQQQNKRADFAKIQWQPTLVALLGLLGDSVQLRSLDSGATGQLTLVAAVADERALAQVQRSLQSLQQPLTIRAIQWQRDGEQLILTANLQVSP